MKTLNAIVLVGAIFLLGGCQQQDFSASSFAPHKLTVGAGFTNPIGYNLEDSTLSWQIPLLHNGIKQKNLAKRKVFVNIFSCKIKARYIPPRARTQPR